MWRPGEGGTFPCGLSSPEGPRTVPHGGSSGPGCWVGEKAAQLPTVLTPAPVLPDRAAASTWHTAHEPDLHPCTSGWTWSLLTLHAGVSWCWTPVLACPTMTHGPHNRVHPARHPLGTSATQRNQAKHTDSRTLLPSPPNPQIDETRKTLQRQDPCPQGTPPGAGRWLRSQQGGLRGGVAGERATGAGGAGLTPIRAPSALACPPQGSIDSFWMLSAVGP